MNAQIRFNLAGMNSVLYFVLPPRIFTPQDRVHDEPSASRRLHAQEGGHLRCQVRGRPVVQGQGGENEHGKCSVASLSPSALSALITMYSLGVERYLYSGFIIPNADCRPLD